MTAPEYTPPDMVEFAAKVPRRHYEAFAGLFPQYGASAWFIRKCLDEFLQRVENDPTAVERIRESIDNMVKNSN